AHLNTPAEPANQPHEVGKAVALRDEIDELRRPLLRLKRRDQDQRAIEVTALDPSNRAGWRDQPTTRLGVAENRGKTDGRITPPQMQPIHGTIASDERRGRAIADQGIVFDSLAHRHLSRHLAPAPINSA